MTVEGINQIYNIIILIGFIIPILNIVTGTLGLLIDFGLHIHTGPDGLIPFNAMSLCLSFIVFGVLEKLLVQYMSSNKTIVLYNGLGLSVAFIVYMIFYKIVVYKLRSSNPVALTTSELVGMDGIVTLRIKSDEPGTISVIDSTGAKITYIAVLENETDVEEIAQGQAIKIVGFDSDTKKCRVIQI